MSYTTVIPNNYFFSQEILQLIQQAQIDGQTPKDFGYPSLAELENHIQSAFQQTLLAYSQFKIYLEEEDTNKTAQPTQDFAIVFLKSLGYTPQRYLAPIVGTNQKQYSITYGDPIRAKFPIHIVPHLGKKNSLDSRLHDRYTPHNLLQEYLNTSEQLFGLLTNGTTLRLLRQSNRLVNPPFLTINLQQMLEEEKLEEFALVYRLLHVSRAPQSIGNITECLLEKYYQKTVESGSRIREKLGEAVKQAIIHLANSFLKHPANKILRQQLAQRTLSTKELYAQLRRIIYRMLFLLVLEERRNIFPSTSYEEELPSYLQEIYYQYYSISRLRILAEKELSASALRQSDFWQRVLQTFKFFEPQNDFSPLGIEPLNGDLFSTTAISNLQNCQLTNKDFIQVLRYLHFFEDEKGYRLQINYRALDVEELGSVYERLLALHPIINDKLEFSFDEGMERKSTGSYYTPHDLVKELIQSALIPVIEERLKAHEGDKKKQIQALREISICDPACGSGHMLLEAARTLAMEIAKIESGEEEPSPELYRRVLRQVVQENIYGVDLNPDAVELCKVALWLEGHNSGKPLSFLDHKIRCGNSLVGVVKPEVLRKGIPSAAYEAKEGDDKKICQSLKKDNQNYLKTRQGTLDFDYKIIEGEITEASQAYERIIHLPQEKLVQVEQVAREYRAFLKSEIWYKEWQACNLWVAPFFLRYTSELKSEEIPTSERLEKFLNASAVSYNFMLQKANSLSVEYRFFHWYLEFPNVFTKGGFDVMLGNPPWEVPEVKDKEFFKAIPSIAQVSQANIRKKLIQGLKNSPKEDERELYQEYLKSITYHEAFRLFLRESSRFDLTSTGRMNLYSIFAELFSKLIAPQGRAGFIVPTGIATDDSNKHFFDHLIKNQYLVSLFDFENREGIFPEVHRSFKFSLVTLSHNNYCKNAQFSFFLTNVKQLQDKERVFELPYQSITMLNPNTHTCPIFRTRQDASLTQAVYQRTGVLINEKTGENPWQIKLATMFDMSGDSHLFRTLERFNEKDKGSYYELLGNSFYAKEKKEVWLPLYEAKMIWHYDHRYGSYKGISSRTSTQIAHPTLSQYQDPNYQILPWYWVEEKEVTEKLNRFNWNKRWIIGFRSVAGSTNERTFIASVFPYSAASGKMYLILNSQLNSIEYAFLLSNLNSCVFDYFVRQKIGATDLSFHFVKQFPVLKPQVFTEPVLFFIFPRVLELVYTSWDIKAFADDVWQEADENLRQLLLAQWQENADVNGGGNSFNPPIWCKAAENGFPLAPFVWQEQRRAQLMAELDALYALLYGLNRKQLRYILDPSDLTPKELEDILSPEEEIIDPLDPKGYEQRQKESTFIGETFRVLKKKEIEKYGEYRKRRLVLSAFSRVCEQFQK